MIRRSRISVRPNVGRPGRAGGPTPPQEAPNLSPNKVPAESTVQAEDNNSTTAVELKDSNNSAPAGLTPEVQQKSPDDHGEASDSIDPTASTPNLTTAAAPTHTTSSPTASIQRRKRFAVRPKVTAAPNRASARQDRSQKTVDSNLGDPSQGAGDAPTAAAAAAPHVEPTALSHMERAGAGDPPTPQDTPLEPAPPERDQNPESLPASSAKEVPPKPPDKGPVPPSLPEREAREISERARTLVAKSCKVGPSLPQNQRLSHLLHDQTDLQRLAKAQRLRDLLRQEMSKEKEKTKLKNRKSRCRIKEYSTDPSKMTMRDLVHYLPASNPMTSYLEESTPENETVVPASPAGEVAPEIAQAPREAVPRAEEDHRDDVEEEEEDDDGEGDAMMVPRVKVAEDGSLIIDEESLTVEVKRAKGPNLAAERDAVFERGSTTTYSSFRKKNYTKAWSSEETDMFFLAVSMVGTDFSMICQLFPHRARSEIKNKFKKEERANSWRVDKAFKERRRLDLKFFSKLLEKILEFQKNKKKKPRVPSERKTTRKPRKKANVKKTAVDLSDVEEDPLEGEEEEEEEEGSNEQEDPDYAVEQREVDDPPESPVDPASTETPVQKPKKKGRNRSKKEQQAEASVPEEAEAALPEDHSTANEAEDAESVIPTSSTKPSKPQCARAFKPLLLLPRNKGKRAESVTIPQEALVAIPQNAPIPNSQDAPSPNSQDAPSPNSQNAPIPTSQDAPAPNSQEAPGKVQTLSSDDSSSEQVDKDPSRLKKRAKKRKLEYESSDDEDVPDDDPNDEHSSQDEEEVSSIKLNLKPTRYGRMPKATQHLAYPAMEDSAPDPESPSRTPTTSTPRAKRPPTKTRSSKTPARESKKPTLVTLRASQSDCSDEEEDAGRRKPEWAGSVEEEDLPHGSEGSSGDSCAPVFVPASLRSPNPVVSVVEETMEELHILVNVPEPSDPLQDPAHHMPCVHAQNETDSLPFEHSLDLLADVIDFLSPEQMGVSDNEAAHTLLTIGNRSLQSLLAHIEETGADCNTEMPSISDPDTLDQKEDDDPSCDFQSAFLPPAAPPPEAPMPAVDSTCQDSRAPHNEPGTLTEDGPFPDTPGESSGSITRQTMAALTTEPEPLQRAEAVETPEETPEETPVQTAMETPEETPVETAMETVMETPEETPVETGMETVMETPEETPVETGMETVMETPEETPVETGMETTMETMVQTAMKTLEETLLETVMKTPALTAMETPVQTPVQTPVETPVETHVAPLSPPPSKRGRLPRVKPNLLRSSRVQRLAHKPTSRSPKADGTTEALSKEATSEEMGLPVVTAGPSSVPLSDRAPQSPAGGHVLTSGGEVREETPARQEETAGRGQSFEVQPQSETSVKIESLEDLSAKKSLEPGPETAKGSETGMDSTSSHPSMDLLTTKVKFPDSNSTEVVPPSATVTGRRPFLKVKPKLNVGQRIRAPPSVESKPTETSPDLNALSSKPQITEDPVTQSEEPDFIAVAVDDPKTPCPTSPSPVPLTKAGRPKRLAPPTGREDGDTSGLDSPAGSQTPIQPVKENNANTSKQGDAAPVPPGSELQPAMDLGPRLGAGTQPGTDRCAAASSEPSGCAGSQMSGDDRVQESSGPVTARTAQREEQSSKIQEGLAGGDGKEHPPAPSEDSVPHVSLAQAEKGAAALRTEPQIIPTTQRRRFSKVKPKPNLAKQPPTRRQVARTLPHPAPGLLKEEQSLDSPEGGDANDEDRKPSTSSSAQPSSEVSSASETQSLNPSPESTPRAKNASSAPSLLIQEPLNTTSSPEPQAYSEATVTGVTKLAEGLMSGHRTSWLIENPFTAVDSVVDELIPSDAVPTASPAGEEESVSSRSAQAPQAPPSQLLSRPATETAPPVPHTELPAPPDPEEEPFFILSLTEIPVSPLVGGRSGPSSQPPPDRPRSDPASPEAPVWRSSGRRAVLRMHRLPTGATEQPHRVRTTHGTERPDDPHDSDPVRVPEVPEGEAGPEPERIEPEPPSRKRRARSGTIQRKKPSASPAADELSEVVAGPAENQDPPSKRRKGPGARRQAKVEIQPSSSGRGQARRTAAGEDGTAEVQSEGSSCTPEPPRPVGLLEADLGTHAPGEAVDAATARPINTQASNDVTPPPKTPTLKRKPKGFLSFLSDPAPSGPSGTPRSKVRATPLAPQVKMSGRAAWKPGLSSEGRAMEMPLKDVSVATEHIPAHFTSAAPTCQDGTAPAEPQPSSSGCTAEVDRTNQDPLCVRVEEPTNISQYFLSDIFTEVDD